MSAADVELVRSLIPPPGVDLVALFGNDALAAAAVDATGSLFAPGFVCTIVFPGGPVRYEGLDGLRQGWVDWLEPYSRYFTTVDDLIDLDGQVVALVRDRGYRDGLEEPIEALGAAIWTVSGGRVDAIEFYATRAQGLAAAGLE